MTFVFDIDGTLVDSSERHVILLDELLCEYGYNSKIDQSFLKYKSFGNSTRKYLTEILLMDEEMAEEVNKAWIQGIEEISYLKSDVLYDDTMKVLDILRESGQEIYYLSSRADRDTLLYELKWLGIFDYAKEIHVVNPGSGNRDKSYYLAGIINRVKDKVIMAGDTEMDYLAATEAGCQYYMLNRGFRNKAFWMNRYHIKSYDSMSGLIKISGRRKLEV